MAIVRVTVGSKTPESVNISSVVGSGPWTVTLAGAPSADTVIGDTLTDEAASPNSYLITGISGADLTVKDAYGNSTTPSAAGTSQATTVRSYTGLEACAVDWDDSNWYGVSDIAEVAVCENLTAAGGTIDFTEGAVLPLTRVEIFGHESYRHAGSVGSGVKYTDTSGNGIMVRWSSTIDLTVSWLLLEKNGTNQSGSIIKVNNGTGVVRVHHCIMWGANPGSADTAALYGVWGISAGELHVSNCLIYDLANSGETRGYGLFVYDSLSTVKNCTVYGCGNTGMQRAANGPVATNCISMNTGEIDFSAGWGVTSNNNYSLDTTAPGGLSLTEQVVADTFTDFASSDFSLKSDANAVGAGANLEGDDDDIETDMDGDTRPSTPTAWDIGYDYYVAGPVGSVPCSTISAITLLGL